MAERPKDGADPDATVMIPGEGPVQEQDPEADDATVMIPAGGEDPEATVMLRDAPEADPDATVMLRDPPEPDADATVMLREEAEPDADATVMLPAGEAEPGPAVDPDATVAIPTPGRRRGGGAPPAAIRRELAHGTPESLGGLNPLVAAANPILAVVPHIRQALRHPDPAALRARLREGLDAFERDAFAAGYTAEVVAIAGQALCALLDESAASTPWGRSWAGDGLLAERHGRAEWADGFFAELEKLSQQPGENLELLEFLYVCLALDFEGRHRGTRDGRDKLAQERLRLRQLLRAQRPANDGELSVRWRGVNAPARKSRAALALWAAGCGAALVLVLAYLGFSIALGMKSDPVARELARLKVPELPPVAAVAPAPPVAAEAPAPAVAALLADEVKRGLVTVTDAPGRSTVLIRSDQLFASGSARIEPAVEPVVGRIAEALDKAHGTIVVTGHTDDVPIRTARFPSNWELSAARAESVVRLMAGKLKDPARLRAEGVADSEPVAPNDSAANRARNRRVAVILRTVP